MFEVKTAFGTKGYISASLRPMRDFDDANKSVTFRFKVIEGVQYKMGAFSIVGIPAEIAAHLKSQWTLAPGDVYNASYADEFVSSVVNRDMALAKAREGKHGGINMSAEPDRQSSTVNVTITFK